MVLDMPEDLPDDWEAQIARAYTTFNVDPLDWVEEFGPLDNLRRTAQQRAETAMRQARIVRPAGSEGIPGNGLRVLASVPGRPQHRAYEAATEAASNPAGGRRPTWPCTRDTA